MVATALPCCMAQTAPAVSLPKPGKAAPDIKLDKLLNAPQGAGTSWDALRGKVVVLEFWGTYCPSCVNNIPRMNKLEAGFANDPVVFLHVTNEDETTVRRFLEETPISGWVGIDNDGATFRAYGVTSLPQLAIVGKDGRLLGWMTQFGLLNEPEVLTQILKTGSSPELSKAPSSPVDPMGGIPRTQQAGSTESALCDIIIRRSIPNRSKKFASGADSRGDFYFDHPLLAHISWFWEVPKPRIITETALPEETYDIIALSKRAETPEFRDVVRRLIEVTFDLSIARERRAMDVYVVRPLPGCEPELVPTQSGAYTEAVTGLYAPDKSVLERMKAGEHFFYAICSLGTLADDISNAMDKPVVAELGDLPTKYDRYYTICFPYEKDNVRSLIKGLEKHVGFTLIPGKREVEVLVVRRAGGDDSTTDSH